MKRFKNINFWLGLLILTGIGFLLFTLVSGIGYMIALVFLLHCWWYITLGTLLGMVAVLFPVVVVGLVLFMCIKLGIQ